MAQHEESQTNQSIFSTEQCLELRKKITLSSLQLIQLTYNEQKFNNKLEELNKMACNLIDQEKCLQASVYLDEAERILQYAAGCGKTIERTLITTILNNQACLLQRTSEFQQSANYLEAIIFNINEFIEGSHHFEYTPDFLNLQAPEFAEIAIYFQRKLALALYHLRFCALTSHTKNNEAALKSARLALNTLKELCEEEHQYEAYKQKIVNQNMQKLTSLDHKEQCFNLKKILRDLSRVLQVQKKHISQFELFKEKCLESIAYYQKKVNSECLQSPDKYFQTYSIGNLMQASPIFITSKPSHDLFLNDQYSSRGKLLKVVHLSMAHFTVATELRLISASKYSLDDNERRSCPQFCQSKIFHLLAITLVSRYLPFKSVFFDHAVTSFRNHYGIDLLQEAQLKKQFIKMKDFSVIFQEQSKQQSVQGSISHIDEIHTYEEDNKSGSLQNQEIIANREEGFNLFKNQMQLPSSKQDQDLMKQINNDRIQNIKKLKQLKSKGKSSSKHITTTSFSRVLDTDRNTHLLKNKENKSKMKLMVSKGKQTAKSRRKDLRTEEDEYGRRGVYYGFQKQSRSRSKKPNLQRKNSKKLITRALLTLESKKLRNETKVGEEYGVKSAGNFGFKTSGDIRVKNKPVRNSQGPDDQNMFSPKAAKFSAVMKKVKSPTRAMKGQGTKGQGIKKKSMSKDKYMQ